MKTTRKILILIIVLLIIWVGAIIYANILTAMHGNEFVDADAIGLSSMHPWEGNPNFRVLFYSKKQAKVYYYGKMGGEKVLLINNNGKWKYEKTILAWSEYGGTADDYLVWPYFKNWVI